MTRFDRITIVKMIVAASMATTLASVRSASGAIGWGLLFLVYAVLFMFRKETP